MKVLVIEDDAIIGRALAQGLQEAGHECELVANGRIGLAKAQSQTTDSEQWGHLPERHRLRMRAEP